MIRDPFLVINRIKVLIYINLQISNKRLYEIEGPGLTSFRSRNRIDTQDE